MIVVLGIIALLVAVVVPNINRFASKGEEGSKQSEKRSVQTAMDAMMADRVLVSITGLTSSDNSVSDWAALPGGSNTVPLAGYLEASITAYFYCYDGSGVITRQDPAATACP